MIDNEKVALMTKMAAFEKHEGKKNMNILNYYRSDYIGCQVLNAIIAATLSFVLVGAIYLLYNFEMLMADIYKMDLMALGKQIITIYLCLVGIYSIIVYIVYTYRYAKAKRKLKTYYMNLRQLENMDDR